MAIKWLDAKRLQGTNAERLALSPKVANFDGSGDIVTGLGDLMSGTGDWSASIWFYHTGGTSSNDGIYGNNGVQQLCYYQGSSQKILAGSGGARITSSITVDESTWYHLAFTRSSGSEILYLDGVSVATGTDTTDTASSTWRIGTSYTGEDWAGSLIEFAVWNDRVLTLAEVQSIYNSGNGKKIPDATLNVSGASYTTDLTGYYPMDTDFDKFAGTGGNNGTASGDATANNSSPASPLAYPNLPENTLFEETNTYRIWWLQDGAWKGYITRGCVGGGNTSDNVIDYITIASAGNATDFGDLTVGRAYVGAFADSSRGCWGGGYTSTDDTKYNVIDYITVATTGNATDFGDLTAVRNDAGGCADSTRGSLGGGSDTTYSNVINYVTIATVGNATDFGDLTVSRQGTGALADTTRGVFAGGNNASDENNTMDYITIATTGNASDFGDLLTPNKGGHGVSNNTRGCWMGGRQDPTPKNVIQYITIATTGNAVDFGDLTAARHGGGSMSDLTTGCLGGGLGGTNVIDSITIDTTGNAVDFGDLTVGRYYTGGLAA